MGTEIINVIPHDEAHFDQITLGKTLKQIALAQRNVGLTDQMALYTELRKNTDNPSLTLKELAKNKLSYTGPLEDLVGRPGQCILFDPFSEYTEPLTDIVDIDYNTLYPDQFILGRQTKPKQLPGRGLLRKYHHKRYRPQFFRRGQLRRYACRPIPTLKELG